MTPNRDPQPESNAGAVTRLLGEIESRGPGAVEALFPLVYDELRRLAQHQLGGERADHTLQATALVNEAYLKLVGQTRVDWQNRAHFMAVAAQAIRRVLVDHARHRARDKRGGGAPHLSLTSGLEVADGNRPIDLLDMEDALDRLAQEDPTKAKVVELRFFGGLTNEEVAAVIDTSLRTVERHWQYSRAWLFRELS